VVVCLGKKSKKKKGDAATRLVGSDHTDCTWKGKGDWSTETEKLSTPAASKKRGMGASLSWRRHQQKNLGSQVTKPCVKRRGVERPQESEDQVRVKLFTQGTGGQEEGG